MEIVSEAAKFGPYAFILMIVLAFGWKTMEKVLSVVENNTTALTKLASSADVTTDKLTEHDARSQRMEAATGQIIATTGRIEQKLDRALDVPRNGRQAG